jgi:ABC-type multidrug transport system fused ATPase/permease subunit
VEACLREEEHEKLTIELGDLHFCDWTLTWAFCMSCFQRTGELINRLSSDSTILKDAATTNISMGLRWMATVIIGIGYLFWCSWSLTLVMLSVVPPVAIGARYFGKKIRALSKSTQDALAEATTTAEESISAIRTIRSFGKEEYAGRMYAEKIEVTFQLGKSIALQYGLFIGLLGFLASLAMIIVLYYGSIIVLRGDLTTGALTAYVLYTLTVGMALGGLSGLFASFMQALGACERIFELLDREPSLGVDKRRPPVHGAASAGAGQGRIPSGRPRGEVVLKDVFFSYPSRPETQVLKGVNLTLQPGTTTALVGPSGHGKSTIVALIERFYDIDSETSGPPSNGLHGSSGSDLSRYAASGITIDGVDLRDLDLHWLHSNVGLISQVSHRLLQAHALPAESFADFALPLFPLRRNRSSSPRRSGRTSSSAVVARMASRALVTSARRRSSAHANLRTLGNSSRRSKTVSTPWSGSGASD